MSDKPRIAILGGENRHVPEPLRRAATVYHFSLLEAKSRVDRLPERLDAVVCLGALSEGAFVGKVAKALGGGVPVIGLRSSNWTKLRTALLVHGIALTNGRKPDTQQLPLDVAAEAGVQNSRTEGAEATQAAGPEAVAGGNPPNPSAPVAAVETTGLTVDELWAQYGRKAIDCVRAVFMPKEAHNESVVVEMLGMIGLPAADAETLLPELAVRGILDQLANGRWQLMSTDELLFEQDEPRKPRASGAIPAAAKARSAKHRASILRNISGIPLGPYATKRELMDALWRYEEFARYKKSMMRNFLMWAEAAHVIELHHGKWYVDHDASVTLTPRKEAP